MISQSPSARSTHPHVVVVGGGVIGVSGTISPGHPPLNDPGRVREAIWRMLDPSSPLYVSPRWDPALWRWLATFARHVTHRHVREAMAVLAPMGHRALERG